MTETEKQHYRDLKEDAVRDLQWMKPEYTGSFGYALADTDKRLL